MDVAHDQGDGILFARRATCVEVPAKPVDAEFSPASREVGGSYLSNLAGRHSNIIAGGAKRFDQASARSWTFAPTLAFTLCPGGGSDSTRPAWRRWRRRSGWRGGSASSPGLPAPCRRWPEPGFESQLSGRCCLFRRL